MARSRLDDYNECTILRLCSNVVLSSAFFGRSGRHWTAQPTCCLSITLHPGRPSNVHPAEFVKVLSVLNEMLRLPFRPQMLPFFHALELLFHPQQSSLSVHIPQIGTPLLAEVVLTRRSVVLHLTVLHSMQRRKVQEIKSCCGACLQCRSNGNAIIGGSLNK